MKYIIFQDFAGEEVPFIFPERVEHVDMREQLPYAKVVSAGSISLQDGCFHCEGSGGELAAHARPEDAALIARAFGVD